MLPLSIFDRIQSCEQCEQIHRPAFRRLGLDCFGLWLVAEFPANVWPKLFHHDRNRIVPNLRAPHAGGIWRSSIGVRMVTVRGDPSRDRASEDLGVIEPLAARVRARDKNPAHRIALGDAGICRCSTGKSGDPAAATMEEWAWRTHHRLRRGAQALKSLSDAVAADYNPIDPSLRLFAGDRPDESVDPLFSRASTLRVEDLGHYVSFGTIVHRSFRERRSSACVFRSKLCSLRR